MAIVNPLPYNIQDGQAIDAVPVMANLNQIVSNVNANAAPVAGNASQTFAVANATATNEAVNLGQANGLYAPVAGNATQTFAVANATATNQAVQLGQSISGATIKNVKASRSAGVVYTNTSPRAISVQCSSAIVNAGDALQLVVNGISVAGSSAATNGPACAVVSIVPPNSTYELTSANNGSAGVGTIYSWVEVS